MRVGQVSPDFRLLSKLGGFWPFRGLLLTAADGTIDATRSAQALQATLTLSDSWATPFHKEAP